MSQECIYGIHAVLSLLQGKLRQASRLLLSDERSDKKLQMILELAQQKEIPIEFCNPKVLKTRFPDATHQGVIAYAPALPPLEQQDIPRLLEQLSAPAHILILDGVTDPHNLGACLRSADAAGVDFVIVPKDKSASINATVAKVACGALEFVPLVRVSNLARAIDSLKSHGVWCYGAAGEAGKTLYQFELTGSVALIMGAEGDGLRRLTRDLCDELFSLPMHGAVSSLNVSVATGISLYEVVRQRAL